MSATPFRAMGRALLNARSTMRSNSRNSSAYKPPANWKPPHYDELPVPEGPWQAHYDAKQRNYNIQLIVGIIAFTSTVGFIVISDKFFFNYYPPPLPEE